MNSVIYVGMDVHKETVFIVGYKNGEQVPSIVVQKKNRESELRKYFKKLQEKGELLCCYEAGPSGYSTYRMLEGMGIACLVAAPGLIPKKPSERIKTDKRDADMLARNLRSGQLTGVHIPTRADEAVREFLHVRDDYKDEQRRYKQKILSLLLRHGLIYRDGDNWTGKHRLWIKKAIAELNSLQKETVKEYLGHLDYITENIKRIDQRIEALASEGRYREKVKRLMAIKGIGTFTALSIIAEISDFRRFAKPSQFMSYLGLVPAEHSSGERRRQNGITKSGNKRLRRLLVESAWHCRTYDPSSKRLIKRRREVDPQARAYADKAGKRLSRRYQHLLFTGKPSQKVATAVARELCGFIWGIMREQTT
ncbi:MAG: IS110 family transposase [Spirochaetia bacterium]|nr:IS110 family transposase [Spirochaetia bacterium]